MPYGDKPFGLRDIKITDIDGNNQEDLPAGMTMSFTPRVKSGELSGDDKTVAVASISDALEWELEAGGIGVDAWAIMTGRTVSTSGTSPNEETTYTANAQEQFPYFKIYGKSIGDGDDDVHVKIYKAKLTEPPGGEFADGEFFTTSCSGVAIDDGTNGIYEVVQNETAASLPSS